MRIFKLIAIFERHAGTANLAADWRAYADVMWNNKPIRAAPYFVYRSYMCNQSNSFQ